MLRVMVDGRDSGTRFRQEQQVGQYLVSWPSISIRPNRSASLRSPGESGRPLRASAHHCGGPGQRVADDDDRGTHCPIRVIAQLRRFVAVARRSNRPPVRSRCQARAQARQQKVRSPKRRGHRSGCG